jgi:flagellar biosynthetic protein FliQ
MNEEIVMNIGAEAIKTIIYLAGPMLIAAMVMGILISILQAITQINESTLTFIPKMVAILVVLAVMAPWMLEVMKQYTVEVISSAGELVHQQQ